MRYFVFHYVITECVWPDLHRKTGTKGIQVIYRLVPHHRLPRPGGRIHRLTCPVCQPILQNWLITPVLQHFCKASIY